MSGATYANQGGLPRLPIPKLEDTMSRVPDCVRALLTDAEMDDLSRAGEGVSR